MQIEANGKILNDLKHIGFGINALEKEFEAKFKLLSNQIDVMDNTIAEVSLVWLHIFLKLNFQKILHL